MARSMLAVPPRLHLPSIAAGDGGPGTSTPGQRRSTLSSTLFNAPNPLPTPRQVQRELSPIIEHASIVQEAISAAWPVDLDDATQLFSATRPADLSLWGNTSEAGAPHDAFQTPSASVEVDSTLLLERKAFDPPADACHQLGLGAKLFELLAESAAIPSSTDVSVILDKSHCTQQVLERIELGKSRATRASQEALRTEDTTPDKDPFADIASRTANDTIVAVRFDDEDGDSLATSGVAGTSSAPQLSDLHMPSVNTAVAPAPLVHGPRAAHLPLRALMSTSTNTRSTVVKRPLGIQSKTVQISASPNPRRQNLGTIPALTMRPITSTSVKRARGTKLPSTSHQQIAHGPQNDQPAPASETAQLPEADCPSKTPHLAAKAHLTAVHSELLAKTVRAPCVATIAIPPNYVSVQQVLNATVPPSITKRKVHFTPPDALRTVTSHPLSTSAKDEASASPRAVSTPEASSLKAGISIRNSVVGGGIAVVKHRSAAKPRSFTGRCDDMFSRKQRDRSRDATPKVAAGTSAETDVPSAANASRSASHLEGTDSEQATLTRPAAFGFGKTRSVLGKRGNFCVQERRTRTLHAIEDKYDHHRDQITAGLTIEHLKAQEASLEESPKWSPSDSRQEVSLTRLSLLHRYIHEQHQTDDAHRFDGVSVTQGSWQTSNIRRPMHQRDRVFSEDRRSGAGISKHCGSNVALPNVQQVLRHEAAGQSIGPRSSSLATIAGPPRKVMSNASVVTERAQFEARLAEWATREAEAAIAGKGVLQPIPLNRNSNTARSRKATAAKQTNSRSSLAPLKKTAPSAFNFASERRLADRREWEARRRAKEKILVELAELERLERQQADDAERKRTRAAQVPEILPVPQFYKKRKLALKEL